MFNSSILRKSKNNLRSSLGSSNHKGRWVGGWHTREDACVYHENIVRTIDPGVCVDNGCSIKEAAVSSHFGSAEPVI